MAKVDFESFKKPVVDFESFSKPVSVRKAEHPLDTTMEDIKNAGAMAGNIGHSISDVASDLFTRNPIESGRDLAYGALTGATKLGETIGTGLHIPFVHRTNPEETFSGVKSQHPSVSTGFLQGAGDYLPYTAIPFRTAGALASSVPYAGKLLEGLTKFISKSPAATDIAKQAVIGGAHGYSEEKDPAYRNQSGATEGLVNSMIAGIMHGGGELGHALRPSTLLRGNLTPEQLKTNLEATKGTETPLGDVVGNRYLKGFSENVLPTVPFSGAYGAMGRNVNKIQQIAQNIGDEFGFTKNAPKNVDVQKALKSALEDVTNKKKENYKDVNLIAEKVGANPSRDNLSKQAKDELDSINESSELKDEIPHEVISNLEKMANRKENFSLKSSNIFRGVLDDKASKHFADSNDFIGGIYSRLKGSLGKDIDKSIENSSSPELKNAHQKAQSFYAENFAPFDNKDVLKFTRKGGDPDLILSHFIKSGKNDRSNLIDTLVDRLPEEDKHIPARAYLSKSTDENGNVDPKKLAELWRSIGENQKSSLVRDPEMLKKLNLFSDTYNINKESIHHMANPNTGQRIKDILGTAALVGSPFVGTSHPLLAAASPLIMAGANVSRRALNNEYVRNKLVNSMIKNKRIIPRAGAKTLNLVNTLGAGYKNEDQN